MKKSLTAACAVALGFSAAAYAQDADTEVPEGEASNGAVVTREEIVQQGDPVLERNANFIDLWERYGAGGGDAALRFRRGYDHFQRTGEYLSWEEANAGLRAA